MAPKSTVNAGGFTQFTAHLVMGDIPRGFAALSIVMQTTIKVGPSGGRNRSRSGNQCTENGRQPPAIVTAVVADAAHLGCHISEMAFRHWTGISMQKHNIALGSPAPVFILDDD